MAVKVVKEVVVRVAGTSVMLELFTRTSTSNNNSHLEDSMRKDTVMFVHISTQCTTVYISR